MKKSYTAYFYTDAEYASTGIAADTPGLALAAACRMKDEDGIALQFNKYDEAQPINHIEILDEKDLMNSRTGGTPICFCAWPPPISSKPSNSAR